jgi:carboxyl-terminal processing protease
MSASLIGRSGSSAFNGLSEANLRGHLKGEDEDNSKDKEEGGSSSYVPQEKDKDTQLKYGLDLLRGIRSVDTDSNRKTEAN